MHCHSHQNNYPLPTLTEHFFLFPPGYWLLGSVSHCHCGASVGHVVVVGCQVISRFCKNTRAARMYRPLHSSCPRPCPWCCRWHRMVGRRESHSFCGVLFACYPINHVIIFGEGFKVQDSSCLLGEMMGRKLRTEILAAVVCESAHVRSLICVFSTCFISKTNKLKK